MSQLCSGNWEKTNCVPSTLKHKIMNLKRIFGTILTVLGIAALIYAAAMFLNGNDGNRQIRELIVYTVLGLIFFVTGISLVRTTKDEA